MPRYDDWFDPSRRLHRRSDPRTSRWSAQFIAHILNTLQWEVLQYAKSRYPEPFTQYEVSHALGSPKKSTHRSRVPELRAKGWVRDTGQVRYHPPSRKPFILWIYVPPTQPMPELVVSPPRRRINGG